MKRLRQTDIRKLLTALNNLHSDITPSSLRERLLKTVKSIVSCEIVGFDIFNSTGVHQGVIPHDPINLLTVEELKIFAAYAIEHPFFADVFLNKRFEALKFSDFLSDEQFHRTGIYNEFYHRVGIERQIAAALPVSAEQIITCSFSRGGKDFTEDDRLLLNLLSTHLTQAIRNTQAFERLQTVIDAQPSNGVVAIDADGRVSYISEAAKRLLEKYFGKGKPNTGVLPETLAGWIREQFAENDEFEFIAPSLPLIIEAANGKLQVRLLYNTVTKEKTLLLEEKSDFSLEKLKSLNLTKRETEILFWMLHGKTDKEIAALLYISPRTAQKHAENIFTKLGVETRTAAILQAIRILEAV